jgi:NAD-dependent SIR2 family protein deacetylase
LLIAAGAGMGVDSGLPDFRGAAGFWSAYPALGRCGIDFYAIASPTAFRLRPRQAWGFYGHRLALYRRTIPHPGFALLKRWARAMAHGCAVFTSNVDGQFQRAGFDEAPIDECHGSIHHLQCLEPCSDHVWPADDWVPEVDETRCELRSSLPLCPRCGGLARPNILMFGDGGWLDQREADQSTTLARWLDVVRRPVVIEVGAGTDVPSVRRFSHAMQHARQARLIRINPREAAVDDPRDVALAMGALEALGAIDSCIEHPRKPCPTH